MSTDVKKNVEALSAEAVKQFTEGSLCDLAHELYGSEFQYTSGGRWFHFEKDVGHWKADPYKTKLILDLFRYRMKDYFREFLSRHEELNDCYKNLYKLGCMNMVNNCVALAKSNFSTDELFEVKLDQNPYLIGDMNGVYDLKTGIHRVGTPEDYVSMKMGAFYHDYTWDHPDVSSVMKFWAKIHVDPVIRTYFLKAISVCMIAGNKEKMILVMTNDDGDAGKSACLKIIEKVFGDYSITLQRERFVVQSNKYAGNAAPDIANAKNKRLGSVKELSKDETLDIGSLKLFSGSDDIQVRKLYKNGGDMQVLLTMILMMNKLPPIPANDKPTWNRLRVIPFESIFNDEAPSDSRKQWEQKHFKPDKDLKGKLENLKDAFYWVFLQFFKEYQEDGLYPLPEKVRLATQRYRESNDVFDQFVKHNFKVTKTQEDFVCIDTNLFEEYSMWFDMNNRGKKFVRPKFFDFKKSCITYFKSLRTEDGENDDGTPSFYKHTVINSKIYGVRRIEFGEEVESDDEGSESMSLLEQDKVEITKSDEKDYLKYFANPL